MDKDELRGLLLCVLLLVLLAVNMDPDAWQAITSNEPGRMSAK